MQVANLSPGKVQAICRPSISNSKSAALISQSQDKQVNEPSGCKVKHQLQELLGYLKGSIAVSTEQCSFCSMQARETALIARSCYERLWALVRCMHSGHKSKRDLHSILLIKHLRFRLRDREEIPASHTSQRVSE